MKGPTMQPRTNRRILLVVLLALTGCATQDGILITAGSSVCVGPNGTLPKNGTCEALARTAAELHTPEMNKAIAEAVAGAPK